MFYYYPYSFFGMHALWWLFWLIAMSCLFWWAVPVRRTSWREYQENLPLTLLQRRYAAGQISTAEYEERKAVLLRDAATPADARRDRSVGPTTSAHGHT